jgi:hypothetical protein
MTKIEEIAHAIRQLTYGEMLEFAGYITDEADYRGLSVDHSREEIANTMHTVCVNIIEAAKENQHDTDTRHHAGSGGDFGKHTFED